MVEHKSASSAAFEPILAGGGIVTSSEARKIAVVHRRRYAGEIGLPKGKVRVEEGETVVHAAEREVREEIGYTVRAIGFAGLTHYLTNGRPKVVFYYRMKIIGHGGGIDTDGCIYCASVHSRFAATYSKREADVQRLLDDGTNADLGERWNAIVAASVALSATPLYRRVWSPLTARRSDKGGGA